MNNDSKVIIKEIAYGVNPLGVNFNYLGLDFSPIPPHMLRIEEDITDGGLIKSNEADVWLIYNEASRSFKLTPDHADKDSYLTDSCIRGKWTVE